MLQNEPSQRGDLEVPYLKAQHVQWEGIRLEEPPRMWASPTEVESLRVQSGDLLVCEGGEVGRGAVVRTTPPENCIIQNALHLVRGREGGDVRFLLYLLRHAATQGWFDVLCNRATIAHLTADKFAEMWIWSPPLPEQRAIADFLDRETARLDALVAAKERWLELLAEKRQAVITHAITRGMNSSARMKPSGIEWLGEVPTHWDAPKRMKHVSSLKGRLGWQGLKAEEYTDEGPFVVSSAHFDGFGIIWAACPHVSNERYEMDSNIQLAQGDVLLMKDGAALGKLAYVTHLPDRACLNSHLLLFRPLSLNGHVTYESRFLFYFMQTDFFQEHVKIYATGTTFLGISQEEIGNYRMALPPLDEQREIVAHIETETAKIDALRAATERTIGLLKERRAALIAAAVTGKVDARKACQTESWTGEDKKGILTA